MAITRYLAASSRDPPVRASVDDPLCSMITTMTRLWTPLILTVCVRDYSAGHTMPTALLSFSLLRVHILWLVTTAVPSPRPS